MAKQLVTEDIGEFVCPRGFEYEHQMLVEKLLESLKVYLPFEQFCYYVDEDIVTLSYNRYETDMEEHARLQRVEAAEYAKYLELKKKFESKEG